MQERDFLPQIPDPIVVTTGKQQIIENIRDQFYTEIMDYLGIPRPNRDLFSDRYTNAMSLANYEKTTGIFSEGGERVGDNFTSYLTVRDLPVAAALIRRNEGNYVQGVFYHNLTVECEREVRQRLHSHSNENIIYIEDPFSNFFPESFTTNIGAPELAQRRGTYLEKIRASLGFNQENSEGIVDIQFGKVVPIDSDEAETSPDDTVAVLKIRGNPIAIVLITVGKDGYARYDANFLTPEAIKGLRFMPEAEK